MPLIWQIPESYPARAIGEYDRTCSPDRFLFLQGRPLGDLPPPTIRFDVRADSLRKFDCLAHSGRVPLVSQRLAVVLSRVCPSDVQFFPAVVRAADGELDGYSLVNATREVAAIDYADSTLDLIHGTGRILGFDRLRHRPGVFDGIHIARERDYHPHLLISETLAGELVSMRAKGIRFTRPEEIHP